MNVTFLLGAGGGFGSPSWTAVITTLIITGGTVMIMCGGFYLIFQLWRMILDVVRNADTKAVNTLRSFLGRAEITGPQKFSAVGAGLLGTILILAFCVAAVVWGLHFNY